MLPYQTISRGNNLAVAMTHTVAVTVLCILTAINFVISLYSHKDDFRKCHDNKNESSQVLWKYGVIHDDGIPFVIIQCQEYQCHMANSEGVRVLQ